MRTLSLAVALLGAAFAASGQSPKPLSGNAGNVFLEGETVSIQLPPSSGGSWRAFDLEKKVVAQGQSSGGRAVLGKLGIGSYFVKADGASESVLLAVIAPLSAPTPEDSPIGVNAGLAVKLNSADQWTLTANLMVLAGVKWNRTPLRWRFLQPQKDGPIAPNNYDEAAEIQQKAGVHVLDFLQGIPAWAPHDEPHHLPEDLRDSYQFFRLFAEHQKGTVVAVEPWSEGDAHMNGAEIASYQKASYLGLKAGNPTITVGSNAWSAGMNPSEIQEFLENEPDPYFDTLNFHHYQPVQQLPDIYTRWRKVAGGKPFWVDELNVKMPPAADPSTHDPSPEDMVTQAQMVARVFSVSLFLDAEKAFYFDFMDYNENRHQFGLLRPDLTPRPAYVALAAVGRFLAGAKPISAWQGSEREDPAVYAFRAVPDGSPRDVLVAWGSRSELHLPVKPIAIYDYLGRSIPSAKLSEGPIFVVLPAGTVRGWASGQFTSAPRPNLEEPPAVPKQAAGAPASPVVLQAIFRDDQLVHVHPPFGPQQVSGSLERIENPEDQKIQLFAYNFSSQTIHATITVQVPNGWNYELPTSSITLPPMGRVPIPFEVRPGGGGPAMIKLRASGPQVGNSVLAFQLVH